MGNQNKMYSLIIETKTLNIEGRAETRPPEIPTPLKNILGENLTNQATQTYQNIFILFLHS